MEAEVSKGLRVTQKPCRRCGSTQRYASNRCCPSCHNQRGKAQYKQYPDKSRKYEHKRKGIPTPEYPDPTFCEICGLMEETKNLAVDHCHKTGHFRGWLCTRCNMGLGCFKDDPEKLRLAITYLMQRTKVDF